MARFNYINVRPDFVADIGDCVVRAITLASGLDYEDVEDKLYYTAQLLDCPERCVCCYSFLLDNVLKYVPVECEGLLVGEFADIYNRGTYLVRMDGHITCIIDGEINDTWDCSMELATNAWNVP